jgi:hypothetical protein
MRVELGAALQVPQAGGEVGNRAWRQGRPGRRRRRHGDDDQVEAPRGEIAGRPHEARVEHRAQRQDQGLGRQDARRDQVEVASHVAEHDGGVQERVEQALELRPAGARLHPAELAAVLDQPHAVLAGEIGGGQVGGAPHGGVDDRGAGRAHLGERVEQQDDVGVALVMMLGDVQGAVPQRRPPVHVADVIARCEGPDVAGLDPLALGR